MIVNLAQPFSKQHKSLLASLLIAGSFFFFAQAFMPVGEVFQFDSDEGLQLAKASLLGNGFKLYQEILSDHPPLYTILLSTWLKNIGDSITSARLLTLFFSSLLIFSFNQFLNRHLGFVASTLGCIWLIFSSDFLRLSTSVMIGLPALSLAVSALYLLDTTQQTKKHAYIWAATSGIVWSLSLQIKLITIYLLPIVLLYYWLNDPDKERRKIVLFSWLSGFFVCSMIFLLPLLLNNVAIAQVLFSHINVSGLKEIPIERSSQRLITMLTQDYDYLLLFLLGVFASCFTYPLYKNLFLMWWLTTFLVFLGHHPLWYHHYPVLAISMVALMSYGVTLAIRQFKFVFGLGEFKKSKEVKEVKDAFWKSKIKAFFLILILVIPLASLPIRINIFADKNEDFIQDSTSDFAVLAELKTYQKNDQKWLFTDMPIYAFYLERNLPPEIATFSEKQMSNGTFNQEKLISILNKYHPEQVLLTRFPDVLTMLLPTLQRDYNEVNFIDPRFKYYLLKDQ